MGNELTITQAIEQAKKPKGLDALSPRQQEEHRTKIGLRSRTVLNQFWITAGTHEAEQVIELEGWVDVLEVLSEVEFRKSWAEYQRSGPRTKSGKLYKPDAGALYKIAMDARLKVKIVPEPVEPEPERIQATAEQRQAIIDDVNFSGDVQVKSFNSKPEVKE